MDKRAFLDSNAIANIVSRDPARSELLVTLRECGLTPVIYAKCMCGVYSMVKGTTKDGQRKRHPLEDLLGDDLNAVSQRIFRPWDDIDAQGTAYFWFSPCEEVAPAL